MPKVRDDIKVKGISVVIPVKNRSNDLRKCVESVKSSFESSVKQNSQLKELQVIVIDDNSVEDISGSMKPFKFAEVITNIGTGPGAARNLGMSAAKFEYVGFIDSDCIADSGWIGRILNGFENNNVNAIQGNPALFEKLDNPLLGRCEEKLYTGMFKRYIDGKYCTQIDTRNCAFKKEILSELKSEIFITDMKKAQAEARVCGNNLVRKGIKILYDENMLVYHKDPSSIRASMRQKMRHGSGRIYVWDKTPAAGFLLRRYYYNPIMKFSVPFWYVIPTHTSFLWGYFKEKWKAK